MSFSKEEIEKYRNCSQDLKEKMVLLDKREALLLKEIDKLIKTTKM